VYTLLTVPDTSAFTSPPTDIYCDINSRRSLAFCSQPAIGVTGERIKTNSSCQMVHHCGPWNLCKIHRLFARLYSCHSH